MKCINHTEADAVDRCGGCAESFCRTCLVEVAGQRYCAACKKMAVTQRPVVERKIVLCKEAKTALTCSLVGIFVLAFILGPVAVINGFKARRLVKEDPNLSGSGLAAAAIVIGFMVMSMALMGLLTRFKGA